MAEFDYKCTKCGKIHHYKSRKANPKRPRTTCPVKHVGVDPKPLATQKTHGSKVGTPNQPKSKPSIKKPSRQLKREKWIKDNPDIVKEAKKRLESKNQDINTNGFQGQNSAALFSLHNLQFKIPHKQIPSQIFWDKEWQIRNSEMKMLKLGDITLKVSTKNVMINFSVELFEDYSRDTYDYSYSTVKRRLNRLMNKAELEATKAVIYLEKLGFKFPNVGNGCHLTPIKKPHFVAPTDISLKYRNAAQTAILSTRDNRISMDTSGNPEGEIEFTDIQAAAVFITTLQNLEDDYHYI